MKAIQFILYVENQHASKTFYSHVLNLKPLLDVPGMTEFLLSENCKLGLMPENGIAKILGDKTPHPKTGNGIPRCELYLSVSRIECYFSRAIASGGKIISEISARDWGDNVGYISDPDGNIIAFAEKINLSKNQD